MEQSSSGSLFDSTNLVIFLWKRKTPIIIATVIAIVASVIFSSDYFIPPRFKSSVIMFPTTNSSISKSLLSENSFEKENILQIGEEEQVEQMLQILNSDEIKERIIEKYDLMGHYRIDKNGKYPLTELNKMFEENISLTEQNTFLLELM